MKGDSGFLEVRNGFVNKKVEIKIKIEFLQKNNN